MNGARRLAIFARRSLAADPPSDPALLLEGDWPAAQGGPPRWSLDAEIDAREAWIDREASRLADETGRPSEGRTTAASTLAHVLSLKLRYYCVRLLRVVAFLERSEAGFCQAHLAYESPHDDDYAALLRQRFGGLLRESRRERRSAPRPADAPRARWRRWAGLLANRVQPRMARRPVLLCGNPRHLENVAAALSSAGMQPWWLYDAPAVGAWLARRPRGEGQLWCADEGRAPPALPAAETLAAELPELRCGPYDLRPLIARWLAREAGVRRTWLARVPPSVARHLARLRPGCVVLDQDATPLARVVVAEARRGGVPSLVVQHGAPCVRFGFAPLAADRFCAWGEPARRQLLDWGIDAERIVVTGCPRIEPRGPAEARAVGPARRRPRLLLLATAPPRDDRPDSVEFHLTTHTYRAMLDAVAECRARFDAELIVRPHPRAGVCSAVAELATRGARVEGDVPLLRQVQGVDCVISCASSAGLEAAHFGARVINLLPAGSADRFVDPEWGLEGTARSTSELEGLVAACLQSKQRSGAETSAFDVDPRRTAAQRVVDAARAPIVERTRPMREDRREPPRPLAALAPSGGEAA